jgi:predicted dehydrogenase
LDDGVIGRVTSVEMNLYLDEIHGSSFFQRWNRYRSQSGGLSIHKSGHYLDLLGWWLNQKPVEVFSFGGLNYYGPNGEMNPSKKNGRHCSTCDEADACAYHQTRMKKDSVDSHSASLQHVHTGKRHLNTAWYSDYQPDACIFDDDIDIEDTYSAVIRYDGGTTVNFSANFSSPFEQPRISFNGTRGRLEQGYNFSPDQPYQGSSLIHYPLFEKEGARIIPVTARPGGHGGGDPSMLEDICSADDTHLCRASARDGAYAIAIGEALWRSSQTGEKIQIADLLGEWY